MSSNELLAVIESMEKERGIARAALIAMVEAALLSASKKSVGPVKDLRVDIDKKTLQIRAFAKVEVVEKVTSRSFQMSLAEAHRYQPNAQLGDSRAFFFLPGHSHRLRHLAQLVLHNTSECLRHFLAPYGTKW